MLGFPTSLHTEVGFPTLLQASNFTKKSRSQRCHGNSSTDGVGFQPEKPWWCGPWCGPGAGLARAWRGLLLAKPLAEFSVNPGLSTGLPLQSCAGNRIAPSILRWQQDCSTHSCADSRIAPMQHKQLGLGTILARAQPCDGAGPAVELPGLWHVVDAQDEGQAALEL